MYDAYIAHTPCGTRQEESKEDRRVARAAAAATVALGVGIGWLVACLTAADLVLCLLAVALLLLLLFGFFVDFSDLAHDALSLALFFASEQLGERLNTLGKYVGITQRTHMNSDKQQTGQQTDRRGDPADRQQVNVMSQQYS